MSPEIKLNWPRLDSFIINDEILYRKWESNDGKNYDLHLVIPKSLNGFVLNQVHNTLIAQVSHFEHQFFTSFLI
jgi:hypothetical protein